MKLSVLISTLLGAGRAHHEGKEVKAMGYKGKKESKVTTAQKECGCGCVPLKK